MTRKNQAQARCAGVIATESGDRTEMRQKGAYRERQVVGQPRLRDALAEQRASRLAAGRGHVR